MVTTILTGILLTIPLQADESSARELLRRYQELYGAGQDGVSDLDGKVLVVRLYTNWRNAPGEFQPLRVRLAGNRVTIEPNEAAGPLVAVVTAEDQEDEAVKAAVGDCIGAWAVTKTLTLRLPFLQMPGHTTQPWQFTDALGEPLAGASAELSLAEYRGPRIHVGRTTLDDAGRLAGKTLAGNLRTAYFTVSHPDYGCAEAGQYYGVDDKVVMPLVRRGTVAGERAIRGRIVDPNGMPVAGAAIQCDNVRTLGEGLINGRGRLCFGLTDANGVFSFYMPNYRSRDDRGELIPPKSQYHVRIDAPKQLGLLPYVKPIENGQETLVVLERGEWVRHLRFEGPGGAITDPAQLETITVLLRGPDRSVLMLHYDDWKEGVPLKPGTYHASLRGPHGEWQFQPVELTRDSPAEVVFRLPDPATYSGRVVHGITGRPMAGAFVQAVGSGGVGMRLDELTDEQWNALHGLASDTPTNDAALDPLHEVCGFTRLVRTDGAGDYSITPEPEHVFYGIVVFERDYLAVMYRRDALQAGPDHFAPVPTIKLFPAATVFVEPAVGKQHVSIMPRWAIDEGTRPAWIEELLSIDNERESSLDYHQWLRLNARQPVPVPAGVSLRLRFEMPYHEEFCPVVIPQAICLGHGETADLGRFTPEPALAVQVKATDSAGQALEGIPIRKNVVYDGKRGWSVPHNTDEQGVARFHVIPHSTGTFGVFCGSRESGPLKATVDYQVGGPEDAGREFVLQLSDEMLASLLQSPASEAQ